MPGGHERIDDMRADEARATGDEDAQGVRLERQVTADQQQDQHQNDDDERHHVRSLPSAEAMHTGDWLEVQMACYRQQDEHQ
jgi:hypothetical protein